LHLDLTHLRMTVPSLSGARNLGISKATGDIIGLTDDDCWYEAQAIESIRAAFLGDKELDGVVAQWVEQAEARSSGQAKGRLSLEAWRRFRGGDASSITLFFKRSLFLELGGFDERFGIGQWFGAGEETDFVLRALAANARLVNLPSARVHHHFQTALAPISAGSCRNARKRARGTGAIYAKHHLDLLIVARGFLAPVVRPLVRGRFCAAYLGLFVAIGRLEGFMRWKWQALP
jgi:GT2 family glycosyltransferase